jgi:hypothetical protein
VTTEHTEKSTEHTDRILGCFCAGADIVLDSELGSSTRARAMLCTPLNLFGVLSVFRSVCSVVSKEHGRW